MMLTEFLVPETVARQDGESAVLDIGAAQGKTVLLTLGINRIVEQESIDVSIQGSPDKTTWTPILAIPQKFYCGTYAMVLDLTGHPHVQFLKANWKLDRWGRGDGKPMFEFYVHAKQIEVRMMAAT